MFDLKGIEPLSELVREVYKDLASPGVQQVGIALATIFGLINTILSPIKFLNERTELNRQNNLKKLAERFEQIPLDSIVEAPPEIAVPITEKLVYVSNDQLRNLYIEILAKASTRELNNKVHPSFVNVLNNLSPDEALILNFFQKTKFLTFTYPRNGGKYTNWQSSENLVGKIILDITVAYPENIPAYLSNLEGLGILSIHGEGTIEETQTYLDLKKTLNAILSKISANGNRVSSNYFISRSYYKGHLRVTDFGLLFLQAIELNASEKQDI